MRQLAFAAALLASACAPPIVPVFTPLSFRSELPVVRAYPTFVFPGGEVALTVRRVSQTGAGYSETCVTVIDGDGTAWLDSCGPDETRRLTFHPTRSGRHYAVLSSGHEFTRVIGSAEFCVIDPDTGADCP